ncbi:MAG: sigma-70 family RNA polymerase sigma factor [Polyangiaceae bacterium]|nr:sigma-70 family RNA polymerase sigma factor [Polyangiaceae bacterium]
MPVTIRDASGRGSATSSPATPTDAPSYPDGPLACRLRTDPALREAHAAGLAACRAAWPGVALEDAAWLRYLEARVDATLADPLGPLCLTDLYLAAACAAGSSAAVLAFEREVAREIDAGLRRVDRAGVQADDVRQSLREKLFTATAGCPAKIEEYAGRGRLRSWVRVTVLRLRIDAERRHKARREVYDERAVGALAAELGNEPELAPLKQAYRAAFRAALGHAFRCLTPRQRNLLRHKLVEGLGTAQVAELYRVHRATMKRWLAEARELLWHETRARFAAAAGVDAAELESALRLVLSNFDVSVSALLRGAAPEGE